MLKHMVVQDKQHVNLHVATQMLAQPNHTLLVTAFMQVSADVCRFLLAGVTCGVLDT